MVRLQGFPVATKTFRIKSDAQDWARQVESEMRKGLYIDRASAATLSVKDAFDRYVKEILPHKRESTATKEIARLGQLQSHFGKYSLAALTPKIVAQFRDMRLADGKSANTVRLDLALLSHLFTVAAREWGMGIARNPVQLIKSPSVKGTERTRRLSPQELERLLVECRSATNPQLGWIVEIALETGMRKSEIMNLHMSDVNLDKREVRLQITKNGDSRTVPLTKRAVEVFHLAMANPLRRGTNLIFFGDAGKSGEIRPFILEKAFNKARLRADITDFTFHGLRHERVSQLGEMNMSVLQMAAITGHKSMQMLKRYSHPRNADLLKLLDKT